MRPLGERQARPGLQRLVGLAEGRRRPREQATCQLKSIRMAHTAGQSRAEVGSATGRVARIAR
jgi:hypothetical protein